MNTNKKLLVLKIIFLMMMIYFILNTIKNKKIQEEELNKIKERFNPLELIKIIGTLIKELPRLGFNIIKALPSVLSLVPKLIQLGGFIFKMIGSLLPFS
jgi:hypothetical protein